MKRVAAAGAAIAVAYVGAVLLTGVFSDRDMRPLFEGVGPSAPYRWVKPPRDFEAGNIPPKPITRIVMLTETGSIPTGGNSEDSQFTLNLAAGAVPPVPGETEARLQIDPLDPAKLGPLPAKLFANGNAYRLAVTYSANQAAVTTFAAAGNVVLTAPVPPTGLLYSADGRSWNRLEAIHVNTLATGADITAPGYFLAVASEPLTSGSGGSAVSRAIVPVLLTVLIAGGLLAVPTYLRGRRPPIKQKPRPKPAPIGRPPKRRR